MQKHSLNKPLSKKVFEACKHKMKTKECYVNIFHSLDRFHEYFWNGKWKIAYGYIRILEDDVLMARHCFIVNELGEAIDPTLFTQKHYNGQDKEYISFHTFDSIDNYLKIIGQNNNIPDLLKPLRKVEEKTSEVWAKKHGYILIR